MSSDSGLPSDSTIERTLRSVVKNLAEGSTVNDVRAATEKQLKLDEGFLKIGAWKSRSKDIIHQAINEEPASSQVSHPSPEKPSKVRTPAPKKPATKRASKEAAPKAKRQRKEPSESELSDLVSSAEGLSETEEESPKPVKKAAQRKQPAAAKAKGKANSKSGVVDVPSEQDDEEQSKTQVEEKDGSESEMSDVLDEAPPPKKARQKSTGGGETKTKATKVAKAPAAAAKNQDSDEAEIKRLQGWLVKCGIRKLWYRELAPYDSPKAKIKHLKEMLEEAGMSGRYSVEKAKAIKEQRELVADLEAVTEGAKKWGHEGDEQEGSDTPASDTRPKRRAAAAARFVDFGDSGEEDSD